MNTFPPVQPSHNNLKTKSARFQSKFLKLQFWIFPFRLVSEEVTKHTIQEYQLIVQAMLLSEIPDPSLSPEPVMN